MIIMIKIISHCQDHFEIKKFILSTYLIAHPMTMTQSETFIIIIALFIVYLINTTGFHAVIHHHSLQQITQELKIIFIPA
jgi:ABC-type sugar transport system permease subunit